MPTFSRLAGKRLGEQRASRESRVKARDKVRLLLRSRNKTFWRNRQCSTSLANMRWVTLKCCLGTVLWRTTLHDERKIYLHFWGPIYFSPVGRWHSSWNIAFTISVFTLTDGNLSDGSFPNIDTCCAFKNLDQLLWISCPGGFMLTDTKYVVCHTDPQGFP